MEKLNGFINIYKEKGYTSHDVVNIVRKSLNRIKTGHTGTLDPQAEGVLPICIGRATKLADLIMKDKKTYKTELILGMITTTQDTTGDVVSFQDVQLSEKEITDVINSFICEYEQTPPMYSAIKVNGQKLYDLARKGIEVERKKRLVKIFNIEIENIVGNKVSMIVNCSKGTYIRSLCADIGQKLGCGGTMGELLRIESGNFHIKNSIKIDDFKKIVEQGKINDIIINVEDIFSDLKKVYANDNAKKYLSNGNKIDLSFINNEVKEEEKVLVYNSQNILYGIYQEQDGYLKPETILFVEH